MHHTFNNFKFMPLSTVLQRGVYKEHCTIYEFWAYDTTASKTINFTETRKYIHLNYLVCIHVDIHVYVSNQG